MKEIKAIDIELNEVESEGVAYYRITPEFRDFMLKCEEKHGIIGFEWDRESLNFGIILNKNNEPEKNQTTEEGIS